MPMTLNVGLSRKVGEANAGKLGSIEIQRSEFGESLQFHKPVVGDLGAIEEHGDLRRARSDRNRRNRAPHLLDRRDSFSPRRLRLVFCRCLLAGRRTARYPFRRYLLYKFHHGRLPLANVTGMANYHATHVGQSVSQFGSSGHGVRGIVLPNRLGVKLVEMRGIGIF